MQLKPQRGFRICYIMLDCCAQPKTYKKFFGLPAETCCLINQAYTQSFELIFPYTYDTISVYGTNAFAVY